MSLSNPERSVVYRRTKPALTTDERIQLLEIEIDKLARDVQTYKDWIAPKDFSSEDEIIDIEGLELTDLPEVKCEPDE